MSKKTKAVQVAPVVESATTKAVDTSPILTKEVRAELDKLPSLSARIRYLNSLGHKTGPIAKALTEYRERLVRYQHVNNVLKYVQKKAD